MTTSGFLLHWDSGSELAHFTTVSWKASLSTPEVFTAFRAEEASRHQRHAMLNDIIWRSIKRPQIPAHKEPTGLASQGGKRPDGITMMPWARGKPLAWDVTVPDTCWITHHLNVGRSWGGGQACSGNQNYQVLGHYLHPHLPNLHRDSRLMGCLGSGVNGRDWKTDNCGYKWPKWDEAPLPEDFHGNPEGQCFVIFPHI